MMTRRTIRKIYILVSYFRRLVTDLMDLRSDKVVCLSVDLVG